MLTVLDTEEKIWEDKPPFRPTLRRSALASARSNIADRLGNASTGEKNSQVHGPG